MQFWRNLPDARLEDGPGGYKVLHLQQGTYFLGRESKMASILLRPCYTELWDLVCEGTRILVLNALLIKAPRLFKEHPVMWKISSE